MKLNQRTAMAMHLMWDVSDVEWYQPTRNHAVKIMASADRYLCAQPASKLPPKTISGSNAGRWNQRQDSVIEQLGWKIWETTGEP